MRAGLAALVLMLPVIATAADDVRVDASRSIAAQFQQILGARLQAALADGGTVAAIKVCADEAPVIAARVGAEHGVSVARRTERSRNPANTADADDRALLARFERDLAAQPATLPEHFESRADGSAFYARAIVVQPHCLACHGPALTAQTAAALQAHYPDDRATGYAPGALRGLARIDWPAPEKEPKR
jgi:nitrate reductase cytochrome c-type subunit